MLVKELYSGSDGGVVTALAKDNNMAFGKPRDLLLGDNFLRKEDRRAVLEEIRVEKPRLVTMGFNCDPWTPLSNFLDEEVRRIQQEIALDHLDFVKEVCELQIAGGRHYLLENPLSSQAWKHMLEKIEQRPCFHALHARKNVEVLRDQQRRCQNTTASINVWPWILHTYLTKKTRRIPFDDGGCGHILYPRILPVLR